MQTFPPTNRPSSSAPARPTRSPSSPGAARTSWSTTRPYTWTAQAGRTSFRYAFSKKISFGEFHPFIQGILGDCWLLSTCAAVAKREDLLHKVVPPDQVKKRCMVVFGIFGTSALLLISSHKNRFRANLVLPCFPPREEGFNYLVAID